MKKIISFIISITMVMSMMPYAMFPVQVYAIEDETMTASFSWKNPEFEYTALEKAYNREEASDVSAFGLAEPEYVTTYEAAGEILRQYMVERVSAVTLYYKIPATEEFTDQLLDGICENINSEAIKHTGKPKEGDSLKFIVDEYTVEASATTNESSYLIKLNYSISYYTDNNQEEELDTAVEALKNELALDGKDDYEIIKAIYDYIVKNISYDYDGFAAGTNDDIYTAYAALINKTTVCQGYATLFYRMALEYGIDCRVISGFSNNEAHGWNIVKLGEKYYNLDSTWDSTYDADYTTHNYFLLGNGNFSDHTRNNEYLTLEFQTEYPMDESDFAYEESSENQNLTEGNYIYIIEDQGAVITSYTGNETDVIIPDTLGGYTVTELGPKAFMNNKTLETVCIPKKVKLIQDGSTYELSGTFMGCESLKEVIFEEDSVLLEIGECAFLDCYELTTIDIPSGVTRLGGAAFQSCESLMSINLPEGLEIIEQNTLTNTGIGTLHLPSTLKTFHFINRIKSLTEITVENGNQLICAEDGVLYECISDDEYRLFYYPEGKIDEVFYVADFATSIYNEAFTYQMDLVQRGEEPILKEIHIKDCKGVGTFGDGTLSRIRSKIVPSDTNPYYKVVNGVLLSKDGTILEQVPRSIKGTLEIPDGVKKISDYAGEYGEVGKIIMPDSLLEIGAAAFWGCSNLAEVEWSQNLHTIGEFSFNECALKEVSLPNSVTIIGNSAFAFCYELECIDLPMSVKEIGWQAFASTPIKKIEIPSDVTYFPFGVFNGCAHLEYIVLPQGITDIGEFVFNGCIALKDIYYGGTSENWSAINVLSGNDILSEIKIHYSDEEIAPHFHVFENYTSNNDATCIAYGTVTAECTICKYKDTKTGNQFGPCQYSEWQIVQEPTCTGEGEKIAVCEICGIINTEVVKATGHSETILPGKAITCAEDGLTDGKKCTVCGTITVEQEPVKTSGHDYGEWETTKEATCTEKGSERRDCADCDAYETRATDALKHNYSTEWTVDQPATQSEDGSKSHHCTRCDAKTDVTEIAAVETIKLSYTKKNYTGKYITKPTLTVKDSAGSTLTAGTDYTVEGLKYNRKTVGRYTVTVTFTGDYEGTKTLYFTIVPKAPKTASAVLYGYDDVQFSWSKSTGASGYAVYYKKSTSKSYKLLTRTTKTYIKKSNLDDGKKYTFKVVPYYKSGSTKYSSLTYKTATVYTLKKLSTPKVTKSGTKVKVKWTNINGETGYQISKSTKKSGTSIVSTYKTTKGTYKKLSATKGKTYYYKVRAYKKVKIDGKTKTIYGPWSTPKKFKR